MAGPADFEPLASGVVCSVRVARAGVGECAARRQWSKLSPGERAALYTRFKATCDVDRLWGSNKLRHLGKGVYEFKTTAPVMRALGFKDERTGT
ncbi:MAG: hypothetical protein WD749_13665 [Phycisphaerales bacterium]